MLCRPALSSCHICRIQTPGALILNHLQEAKNTEKSWSLANNSKFNPICCFNAAVLHPNTMLMWIDTIFLVPSPNCHKNSNWKRIRQKWYQLILVKIEKKKIPEYAFFRGISPKWILTPQKKPGVIFSKWLFFQNYLGMSWAI